MSHDNVASSTVSFERFLKAMGPKMKRLLAANHIPFEDSEDVLQGALLALIYQWDSVRDPESWLLGTLRRHCCLYWRNHRRRLYLAVDSTLLECLSEPMAPPQERDDLLYDLRHMIERLPRRCRSLIELRFQLGYEPAEVARRLGYSDASIGKITNRCVAALAREMLGAGAGRAVPEAAPAPAAMISAPACGPGERLSPAHGDRDHGGKARPAAAARPSPRPRSLRVLEPLRTPRPLRSPRRRRR
jgi:RNA polymerase sigma factor (sigma-70 family)